MLRRSSTVQSGVRKRLRGAAMVEFVVVGPLITVLGLAILQYCLMFFAKSQINHASFMAARAGSVAHADIAAIRAAYQRALVPLYGGGRDTAELATAYARAIADLTPANLRIEILNPTRESFDDYATDAQLNKKYQARAIPNTGLGLRPDLKAVGATSGQTLQDANLLKLRVTHGYEPKVWLMGLLYKKYQQWLDTGADSFHTQLIASGRIPMVFHVTLEMQTEALERQGGDGAPVFASNPGRGNGGQPVNPGDPAVSDKPAPRCVTVGCTVTWTPSDPGASSGNGSGGGGGSGSDGGADGEGAGTGGSGDDGAQGGGGPCSGANCPVCNG